MRRTILFLAALILTGSGCRDSFVGPASLPKPANEERVYFSATEPGRPGERFGLGPVSSVTTDGGDRQSVANSTSATILSSPKNGRIAYYQMTGISDFGRIVVANPDGSGARPLVTGIPGVRFIAGPAILSPNGTIVSYASKDLVSSTSSLCLSDLNGRVLYSVPMACDCGIYMIKFSPDGEYLAYISANKEDKKLHVVSVETGAISNIGQNVGKSFSWSPDSRSLAYSEENHTYLANFPYITVPEPLRSSAISVIDVDGRKSRRILTDTAEVFDVAWSPNGSAIVYARRTGPATIFNTDIWLISVSGSTRRRLVVGNEEANIRPQWTPNGLNIIFTSIPKEGSGLLPQVRKHDMINSSTSVIADKAFGAILD